MKQKRKRNSIHSNENFNTSTLLNLFPTNFQGPTTNENGRKKRTPLQELYEKCDLADCLKTSKYVSQRSKSYACFFVFNSIR